ncbi:MAG: oligosaccharide flippase family protein [Aggregatilineales bacterium]
MYRQLTANSLWNVISVGANVLVGIGLTPYFIHTLGVDRYGVWVFAASLSVARGVLGLLDFGIYTAVIKFVAELLARDRKDQIGELFSAALFGYLVLGTLMAAVIGGAAAFGMGIVTTLFRIPLDMTDTARTLLFIVAAETLFDFPAMAVSGVLNGLQRYDITRAWNLIRLIVYGALSVGLIVAGVGVYALALATFAGELIRLAGHLYYIRRLLPGLRLTRRIDPVLARRLTSFSGQLFGYQLLKLVYQGMDKAIIAVLLTTTALTDYDISEGLYMLSFALVTLIGPFAVPVATTFYTRGQRVELRALVVRVTRYTAAVTVPVALISIVLAAPLTSAWVGKEFAHTVPATQLFVGYVVFWALVSGGQNLLVGVELVKVMLPIFGIGTLINLIVSVIAARTWGVAGVILGTAVGNGVACVLYVFAYRRAFGVTLHDLWAGVILRVYPQAGIGTLVTVALSAWRTPSGWLAVSFYGAVGWFTFAVLFILTGLPADERAVLIRRVRYPLREN